VPEQRVKAIAAWGLVAALWAGAAAWARSPPADDVPPPVASAAVSAKAVPSAAPSASSSPPEPAIEEPYDAGAAVKLAEEAWLRSAAGADLDGGLPYDEEEELLYGGPLPVFDPSYYDDEEQEAPRPVERKREFYTEFEKCVNFKLMFPEYGDFDCESALH
jgi:hypothetical protein